MPLLGGMGTFAAWIVVMALNPRTLFVGTGWMVLGVAVATAALFSMLAFQAGYQSGVRAELDRLGAHILVVPKGCPYDAASMALHGASWPCYLQSHYLAEVCSVPGVATAAPVFMAVVGTVGVPSLRGRASWMPS